MSYVIGRTSEPIEQPPFLRDTKNLSQTVVIRVSNALLKLGLSILLARILGADGYGLYSHALSFAVLLAIPTSLGLPKLVIRYLPVYADDAPLTRGFLLWVHLAFGSLSILVIVAASIIAWRTTDSSIYFVAIPLLFLQGALLLAGAVLRSWGHVVRSQILDQVARNILVALPLTTLFLVKSEFISPSVAMWAQNASLLILVVLSYFWIVRELAALPDPSRTTSFRVREWSRTLLPFSLLAGASIVNSRLDTLMLGFLAPNAQVAFYRVAAAAAIFASFALQAANVALGPRVSTLYSKGAIDELNELLRSTGRRVFLFSVGVALIGVVLGSPAISFLYGEDFLPAYQPLLVLFVGYVMSAFAGPVNTVLAMTGNQNRALFALLIGGGTNVGLNFLLIPTYGALGAAFASAISFLIWNALMLILLVRNTGIRTIPIGGKNVN